MAETKKSDKLSDELNQALKESEPLQVKEKFVSSTPKKPFFGEHPFYKNKEVMRRVYIIVGVVLVVILVAIFYKPPFYKTKTVTNDHYTYSFKFDENAKLVNLGAANMLIGQNLAKNNQLQVFGLKGLFVKDCHTEFPYLPVLFTTNIQGTNYSTCSIKPGASLVTYFKYNGVWQQLSISSVNQKTPVDTKSAQAIVSSIKVTN